MSAIPEGATSERCRHIDAGGLTLSYLEWGRPDAEVMLLLHGFGRDATGWRDVAGRYLDRFRVIALDARGHGDSEWAPDGDYRYSTFAADGSRCPRS